jgi:hypothetical protein
MKNNFETERSTDTKTIKELSIIGFKEDYCYHLVVENNTLEIHKINLKNDDEKHKIITLPITIKKDDVCWLFGVTDD